ncbi:hypothetical protein AMOR_01490 [Anaeromyxobacter oryzae]|uniref:DUF306 domain-containing protein n=1 Tax=Anaeromyxobacter oryzae TaxID=2918170 RepID=A0ABM7WNV7_9BACT|nr:hypothetical protein AMOR_01490 [Anaeromyxobacter oryzae]
MTRGARFVLAVAALMGGLGATPARAGDHDHDGASSPYIVGTWKFAPNPTQSPSVDTEFRFINPTKLNVTLEYAFFELDGTFCGCDRDDFAPNKTTIYTMLAEELLPPPLPGGPPVFSCKGTSGALKSIVFLNDGERIILDGASQVGFQTHAFGDLVETDTSLQGKVMTEAAMQSVPLSDKTREEIRKIHEQCVTVNGPLSQ